MTTFALTGGCLCGNIRYSLLAPAKQVERCHCSTCWRTHGALYASLALVDREALRITTGQEGLCSYSRWPTIHRQFCGNCGCPLILVMDEIDDELNFFSATLDGGAHPGHPPNKACHNWVSSKAHWETIADELPKFDSEPELSCIHKSSSD